MEHDDGLYPERGQTFIRMCIAKAATARHGGDWRDMVTLAAARWGQRSLAAQCIRAAVAGGGSGSGEWGAELADTRQVTAEFADLVRAQTIVGRLQGLRRVPRNTPFIATAAGAVGYWVGQSKAIAVSAGAFDRATLDTLQVAALLVMSGELLDDASPEAENLIKRDLLAACVEALDAAFIDPVNAGSAGVTPAAVTYNVPTITSSGDPADDVDAAVGALGGHLSTASWIMHPRTAAQMGLRAGAAGPAAGLGARGGELGGLPVLTSESVPHDSDAGVIALVDAGGINMLDTNEMDVQLVRDASIEMDDSPSGATDTPTGVTTTRLVSLFQAEAAAMKAVRGINWRVARPGSVVLISGASYPAA